MYFSCFFILIVMGCGNTSGDPTARITIKAEPAEVTPGGNTVITVTVTKARQAQRQHAQAQHDNDDHNSQRLGGERHLRAPDGKRRPIECADTKNGRRR